MGNRESAGAPDVPDELMMAMRENNCPNVSQMLVTNPALINAQDWLFGMTPLQHAISFGHIDVISLLIQHGANIHDSSNYPAMHSASAYDRPDVVRFLLSLGADPMAVREETGETPLHVAAKAGCNSVIEALLQHGCDINALDLRGASPLMNAATEDRPEAVRLLLSRGAMTQLQNQDGQTVFDIVSTNGSSEVAQVLDTVCCKFEFGIVSIVFHILNPDHLPSKSHL
eukprot:c17411_g1_i1.p1 GENE.c17411_g1_i1~~c17411_g1_i1.p1  ORF type:complete len:235 (+),score=34.63 c17411_g1_i1:23-706(+)